MNNLKEFFFDKNNYNFIAKLLLITALVIYLLPLIVGFEGICYDDAAFISFPRIFAAARSFHNGEIPLWDSNLYCGAKPYYTMFESPVYNILLYPFFFFADLNNIDQSFFVLYIIPFCLLTIFSGFGAYYLFKDVIKSNCFISALCGIFYAINPSMGISSLSLIDTFVFAYMPWVILSIAKFLETHKFKWWLMGVIFFVLMNCAYTLNYTIRIYFVVAVIALILFINYFMKDKRNIKYIIFTIFIFIFALGLTSFIWGGIIEGIIWTEKKIERRFFSQIIKEITYSVPPTHLITLFIPGFNGTLDNYHTWGDGFLIHSADRIFSGGTTISFLVIVSFLILIYGKKHNFNIDKNTKLWLFIGHIMNIFAISVMLGRYSPVFYLLFKILPWFFAIPYPFYYHFAQHFGTIIIIASILKIIYKNRKNIHKIINLRTSLIYIGFILFFISVYLILPVYYPESIKAKKLNNFGTLFLYRDFKWFFTNPVILFLLGSCLSIFSGKYINKNFHFTMNLLIIGIMIEYFLLGYTVLYRNQIMPRAHSINKWQAYIRKRHVLPSKFSFYDPVKDLNKFTKKSPRFIADISLAENLAWFSNTRSFVGYDSKPTMKKFQNLSQKFYKNWPYEMWAYSIPKALLNNLNVGYYLIYNSKLGENKLYDYVDENGWWYYASRPVESLEKIKSDHYAKYFQKEDYKIYDLDTPMPYIYFQDKIYSADLEEQFNKLLYSDLRTGAFALKDYTGIVPFQYEDFESSANTTKDFEKLQKKFQILKINMNKNNKLTLTVSAERPVLMIRNEAYHEGWKVKINKKKGNIIQINYLQQGVYLNKGINEISFTFFPKNLYYGIIISLFFLIIFVGVTLGVVLQKILRK